jgi:hypothetical protein
MNVNYREKLESRGGKLCLVNRISPVAEQRKSSGSALATELQYCALYCFRVRTDTDTGKF